MLNNHDCFVMMQQRFLTEVMKEIHSDILEVFILGVEPEISWPLFSTGYSHLIHWFSGVQILTETWDTHKHAVSYTH